MCFVAITGTSLDIASRVPVELQHVRSDRVADCLNDRRTRCTRSASRATIARRNQYAFSTVGKKLLHTARVRVHSVARSLGAQRSRALSANDRRALLANHDARSVRGCGDDHWHDRRVSHTQTVDAVHAEIGIDYGPAIG